MIKKCSGCGVELQNEDAKKIGYTPKSDADLCQRCFRIRHYDDVMISMKQGINSDLILEKINKMDALVLWVVDLFDFEANLIPGMNRHLVGKDIIMVATKRDLLPKTTGNEKLIQFIQKRCKQESIQVSGIVVCGDLVAHAKSEENFSVDEINKAISIFRKNRDAVVIGMANAGKSTLLNAFLKDNRLTTSVHPGTTLDFAPIEMGDYTIYDTPGLTRMDSFLTHIADEDLKKIIPLKTIKPIVFQLKGNQTLSLGGMVRLDLLGCENVSCACYFSDRLLIHRSKSENATKLWIDHLNEMLVPSINQHFHEMKSVEIQGVHTCKDVVIHGLGWFCIHGDVETIKVYTNENVNVTFREGMI